MRKFLTLIISLFLVFTYNFSYAVSITVLSTEEAAELNREVSREEIFNYFADSISSSIPESYKYINLNIKWVSIDSRLYISLQKLVYLNLITNTDSLFNKDKKLSAYLFYKLAEKVYDVELVNKLNIEDIKSRNTTFNDFNILESLLLNSKNTFSLSDSNSVINSKKQIFSNVYNTLLTWHYDKDKITELELLNSAIEWLASWTKDKYTVYFPPAENKDFNESLTWEYEWIWAYVDMETPWEVIIVSPIVWSPAEKSWLKGWDVITAVDNKEIQKDNSLQEVVSWIKWEAWTKVVLTIRRENKTFDVEVTRWNIVIKDVEYKVIDWNTFYIKLKFFGPNIYSDFKKALEELSNNNKIKKVIIDLRSNPGWYLDQVTNMLSFFVPEWKATAVVKYQDSEVSYKSKAYDLIDFSKYRLVILQNSWSASASEIMIWTIKDYFPDTTLIWENTYWKGSVQTIKSYSDGSSLKYTIAKWFTWLTETWIDWVGIAPDIEVIVDSYITDEENDIQLKKARDIR